jgi:two-component system OmpR family response regulator
MTRILIIAYDEPTKDFLRSTLQEVGFEIEVASCPLYSLAFLDEVQPDLIVMDDILPLMEGWHLAIRFRKYSKLPMMIVTGKAEQSDIIMGFKFGIDDYLTKPFQSMELIMRIKSLLKRRRITSSTIVKLGDMLIDPGRMEVRIGTNNVYFPLKEFQLLYTLASYPNQVLTSRQLIEHIWGMNFDGDEHSIDIHIQQLRKKIEALSEKIAVLCLRGERYVLRLHPKPS